MIDDIDEGTALDFEIRLYMIFSVGVNNEDIE